MPLLGMASPARKNGTCGSFMGRGNDDMGAWSAGTAALDEGYHNSLLHRGARPAEPTELHYAMGSTLQIGGSIDVFMPAEWTHDANQLSSGQLGLIFVHIAGVPGERNVKIAKLAGD